MTDRARILVVEDDPYQRGALAEILRREGYETAEADSAESAVELLQGHACDLLVTDYDLGGSTGFWLAHTVARSGRVTSPRALLVTGHDEIAEDAALKVLRKPLDVPRFLLEVKQALTRQPRASAKPPHRIAFTLYINESLPARRTLRRVRELLEAYDASQIALTVVDLSTQSTDEAEEQRVVATPTLVKTFPAPPVWIAGEFHDPGVVSILLDHAGVEKKT